MANKNNTMLPQIIDPTTGKPWRPGGATGRDDQGNFTYPIKPPSKPKPKPRPGKPINLKPIKGKPIGKPLGRSTGGITGPGGKQVNSVFNTY